MREDNILQQKSRSFAIRIIRLYKFLLSNKHEHVLSKQLLRSGTSIGANITEAIFAQSRADFGMKLSIAQKEAAESAYWLDILHETDYLTNEQFTSINNDCIELLKLLQSITKTIYNK